MTCWIAATAIERDAGRIATEQPELWRDVRRFNLPVKLALAAAHRVVGVLVHQSLARLIALAPCRPGSPELRTISRELDAGFARGSCAGLRVNPIYTLHAIDNLALSALSLRLENRAPCVCLGGAAGQAFAALEDAMTALASDDEVDEVVIFGGDQSDASWRGAAHDVEACGVAIVLTRRPTNVRLAAVERRSRSASAITDAPVAHAAAGLARWLEALVGAPAGVHRYAVPPRDGDGIDPIEVVAEVMR